MENFDTLLHRPVDKGEQFNDLIPQPNGNKVLIGFGDTGFSIKKMAEMVKQYSSQMKEVANELQGSSLTESVANVKDFVFNHFQYKADKEDQLLRSPAYAWWIDRFDGIDCKSYSIIASCLLSEMGITHYIRRIKQPTLEPTEWTHVYIIVPVDQTTGDLKNGYYVVDGTLEEDYEPAFIEKDDLLMKLRHYSLNAPLQNTQPGLGLSFGNVSLDNVLSIKNILGQLSCIGGSAYSEKDMKTILGKMEVYFNNLIAKINTAIANNDDEAFALAVNEFYAVTELGITASKKKLSEVWNYCSSNVLKVIIKAWEYYGITVKKAFDTWLNDNFNKDLLVTGGSKTYNSSDLFDLYGMGGTTRKLTLVKTVNYYDPKPKTIPKFQITQYVADSSAATTFDPLLFLSGLSQVAGSFGTGNGSTNPNTGTNINGGNIKPPTQTAGFGWLGWVVMLAGLGFAINGFANEKDKPTASLKNKPTTTRKAKPTTTRKNNPKTVKK